MVLKCIPPGAACGFKATNRPPEESDRVTNILYALIYGNGNVRIFAQLQKLETSNIMQIGSMSMLHTIARNGGRVAAVP
jgi:hypothetical protein